MKLKTAALVSVIVLLLVGGAFREPSIANAAKSALEVLITNDATQPVPVKQVAIAPVQTQRFATFNSGSNFSETLTLYTVPAGKILVIDQVSIASNLFDTGQRLMHVLVQATFNDFIPYTLSFQPVDEGSFTSTGARVFRATVSTTAYAGPGTQIMATATRTGPNGTTDSVGIGLSGHLIDAP